MVNARDIYHKLQVDDCESLGCAASGGVLQFLKKKETEPMRWEAPRVWLVGMRLPSSVRQSQRKQVARPRARVTLRQTRGRAPLPLLLGWNVIP